MSDDLLRLNLDRKPTESKPPQSTAALQFDQAEFSKPTVSSLQCAQCAAQITQTYYEVGGKVVCENCRYQLEVALTGGSSASRFVKATLFGIGAAVLGAGIYYAVVALTGYEIGFVAIVVGLMVGAAVKKGSNGRGGWAYQALAMFLTYSAIVSTYVPFIFRAAANLEEKDATKGDASSQNGSNAATSPQPAATGETTTDSDGPPSFIGLAVGLILLFGLAFVAPFLAGFENIMGIVILGIGLYEAWKMNKRIPIAINGPFSVSAAAAAAGSRS